MYAKRQNKNGETPLHKAVFNGRVRFLLAEMLIHHKADLNIVSAQGNKMNSCKNIYIAC
jgi:ankyrin repeat protein